MKPSPQTSYDERLAAENKKWGDHLQLEISGEWHSWLCNPIVSENYHQRRLLGGLRWPQWVINNLGHPAQKSLDLGCGSGKSSINLYEIGATGYVEGYDVSEARVAEAERVRISRNIPGQFAVSDVNKIQLTPNSYELIFSTQSFHHFVELEYVMEQARQGLTPNGFFVLDEFVGPTQFQWTDLQMNLVRTRLALMPERLRRFRWGALKREEGRPTPAEVEAVSPFESIRSGEIRGLFEEYFEVVEIRQMGGTLQHLLYNGIAHNFAANDAEAVSQVKGICALENALIDHYVIPSDFVLLIGRRRKS